MYVIFRLITCGPKTNRNKFGQIESDTCSTQDLAPDVTLDRLAKCRLRTSGLLYETGKTSSRRFDDFVNEADHKTPLLLSVRSRKFILPFVSTSSPYQCPEPTLKISGRGVVYTLTLGRRYVVDVRDER